MSDHYTTYFSWHLPWTKNSKSIIRVFFLLVQMLSPDQWLASRFFDTSGTHVNRCRSHNQCDQHQQFQWTFCLVDFVELFWFNYLFQNLLLKLKKLQNFITHLLNEWSIRIEVFIKGKLENAENSFRFDWNILFHYSSESYIECMLCN